MFNRKYFINYFKPIKLNFFSLILFELIYKALGTYLLFPVMLHLLRNLMTDFGLSLISVDNIRTIFQSPLNILAIIIMILICCFYFLVEITTICIGLNRGMNDEPVNLPELIKEGFKTSLNYLTIENWLAFPVVLFFLPVLHIGLQSGINEILYLRLFIESYTNFVVSNIILIVTVLVLLILFVLFSLTFVNFTKYHINIPASIALDFKVISQDGFKLFWTLLKIVLTTILIIVGIGIIFTVIGAIITLAVFTFGNTGSGLMTPESYRLLINLLTPVLVCLTAVVSIAIPLLFFSGLEGLCFITEDMSPVTSRNRSQKWAILGIIILIYSGLQGTIIAQSINDDAITVALTGGIITAHRGNSAPRMESTRTAFLSAIENGAEYIEFDIQKTADNVLVVNHTSNIYTTEGWISITGTPYEVLKSFELVNSKTNEPMGERIVSLDEVLDICKDKAKVNIEIKKADDDIGLVEKVCETVKAHDIIDDAFIASGTYQYVLKAEQIDPAFNSLYLTSSNYGDIENMQFDSLSLNQEAIDEQTVDKLHLRGKMIHGWTLDSEEEILNMVNKDVDYLIVDDVRMAQTVLAANRPTQAEQLEEILRLIIYKI